MYVRIVFNYVIIRFLVYFFDVESHFIIQISFQEVKEKSKNKESFLKTQKILKVFKGHDNFYGDPALNYLVTLRIN